MEKIKILLIEDEEFDVQRVLKTVNLQSEQLEIAEIVSDGKSALELIEAEPNRFDVVIMDFQIAGGLMGEELISEIKKISPCMQIIVITKLTLNDNRFEFANRLLKIGAFWYCTKYPTHIMEYIYQPTDFLISIHNAYQKKMLELGKFEYDKKMSSNIGIIMESKKIIGSSEQIKLLNSMIMKYASRDVNVLIYGESGTGKELVAYNLHYNSPRKFENFVRINCGSIPHDLIESELFGYEKFAFTGANKDKKGLFEIADNGTVFLDEIADLPLNTQSKLLRVLQDGEIEKIGRSETIKVNVRVIAASNKNLEDEVRAKRFREDLYYRLNIIPIIIPPLRERKDDIKELLNFFILKYSDSLRLDKPIFSDEAVEEIMNYGWPGNVRELKSFAQRILFIDSNTIGADVVRISLNNLHLSHKNEDAILDHLFDVEKILYLREFEKTARSKYIQFVRENSSSDKQAAEKLGIAQPNFSRLCKELNLK
ncbi:MAG: sigma-54-dependent Fis family transcriptional regulator [Ignavibacteriales bacterium]|nr:sigma-54-dependent Fis family transcriptional regulator [Ignavibacteriales bacterium]